MRQLTRLQSLEQFWGELESAPSGVLLLDYDGTLAPFVTDRGAAEPYPGVRERLQSLAGQERTRLVLISGRSVDDLATLLRLDPLPEIWGAHGFERRRIDGSRETLMEDRESINEGFARIQKYASRRGILDRTEFKPSGAAFHWRGLDTAPAQQLQVDLHRDWDRTGPRYGFEVHEFDGGLELRVPGAGKARAIERLLSEIDHGAPIAFLGDDATDEDGFRALRGRGLSILVRPEFRETDADWWIAPPVGLIAFLDRWLGAAESR